MCLRSPRRAISGQPVKVIQVVNIDMVWKCLNQWKGKQNMNSVSCRDCITDKINITGKVKFHVQNQTDGALHTPFREFMTSLRTA